MPDNAQPFPPSLSAIRSEFQILCDDFGGPAPLLPMLYGLFPLDLLPMACREFGFHQTWKVYQEWEPDEIRARQHWPWVAFAASTYRFEREEKTRIAERRRRKAKEKIGLGLPHDVKELKPSQLQGLLRRIATNSKKLCDDMASLQALANRLGDPRMPYRRGHLSWLDEFLIQNLAFDTRPQIDEDPETMMLAEAARSKFISQLICLEIAATAGTEGVSVDLLAQQPGPKDLAVYNLVRLARVIWESLAGRSASVYSVRPRPIDHPTHANDDRSNFVLFVSAIANLATGNEPTPDQIQNAFTP
jgi:hypothetical protein